MNLHCINKRISQVLDLSPCSTACFQITQFSEPNLGHALEVVKINTDLQAMSRAFILVIFFYDIPPPSGGFLVIMETIKEKLQNFTGSLKFLEDSS